jgi:hypothetical protein
VLGIDEVKMQVFALTHDSRTSSIGAPQESVPFALSGGDGCAQYGNAVRNSALKWKKRNGSSGRTRILLKALNEGLNRARSAIFCAADPFTAAPLSKVFPWSAAILFAAHGERSGEGANPTQPSLLTLRRVSGWIQRVYEDGIQDFRGCVSSVLVIMGNASSARLGAERIATPFS